MRHRSNCTHSNKHLGVSGVPTSQIKPTRLHYQPRSVVLLGRLLLPPFLLSGNKFLCCTLMAWHSELLVATSLYLFRTILIFRISNVCICQWCYISLKPAFLCTSTNLAICRMKTQIDTFRSDRIYFILLTKWKIIKLLRERNSSIQFPRRNPTTDRFKDANFCAGRVSLNCNI